MTAEKPRKVTAWLDPMPSADELRLRAYAGKGTGIDRMLKGLGARIGVPTVSNHTLRRTFGRTMFRSGVEPAVIAKMLGHSSIEQTLRYIGVDGDDMDAAMKIFKL